MKNKFTIQEIALICSILALPFLYLGYTYHAMPSTIATHFNLDGKADGWSSKSSLWTTLTLLSLLAFGLYALLKFLPMIDPKKKTAMSADSFRKTAMAIVILFASLNAIVVYGAQSQAPPINRLLFILIGLFLIYIGNLMNSIKPNYFVGIRLPWTLENEANWRATHRLGSRLFMAGGLIIVIGSLLLPAHYAGICLLVVTGLTGLIPVIFSLVYFKRHAK